MDKQSFERLTPHQVRALAVKAMCAVPTVHRWMRGEPMRDLSRHRIERALEMLGWRLERPLVAGPSTEVAPPRAPAAATCSGCGHARGAHTSPGCDEPDCDCEGFA